MPVINGTFGDDTLNGTDGNDEINGLEGRDTIDGGSGNDVIHGGWGRDRLYGGDGDDIIYGGENFPQYGSTEIPPIEFIWDGPGNDFVYGEGGEDWFYASPGDDYYDGGTGSADGWFSFDQIFYTDASAGIIVEYNGAQLVVRSVGDGDPAGIGVDTLVNIEGLVGTRFDDILVATADGMSLWGGDGNDFITGGSGDDRIDGGAGDDILVGGAGQDSLLFRDADGPIRLFLGDDSPQDTGAGIDTISGFENVEGAYGHENYIVGTSGNNDLRGGQQDDRLYGAGGSDWLGGGGGEDYLDGGAGADEMGGGDGDDTYVVDDAGDIIYEEGWSGSGNDTILSSISWTLLTASYSLDEMNAYSFIENVTLTGSANNSATGNNLANILTGNSGSNILSGLEGNDQLFGVAGNDSLVGGTGNDTLDGGAGIDAMRGGLDDDTYYVDNISDKVIENSGEGIDTVYSSASFSLRSNVEHLVLTGSALRGNGNNLANQITGNDANNIINGGLGADVLTGGAGNDLYYVDNSGDNVVEASGGGRDRVYTSISLTLGDNLEDLFARGSSAINLTGNALDNVLRGNSAANILDGGAGADDLKGGAGADTFVFDDGDFGGMTPSTSDRIMDFRRSDGDRIDLSAVDANSGLSGDQAFAFIGTGAFTNVAGELRYEQVNGNTYVYGDTDGDGTADFMLRLDGTHSLIAGDFVI